MLEKLKNKPFIIAEVGSNWASFEDCMRSISLAKACGADAVKFQAFNGEALYGLRINTTAQPLPLEWLPKLKEKCDAFNIELMCSAFSPELLDAVNPYVNIHKLASSEMCYVGMLNKITSYKKPIIISTGAQTFSDIGLIAEYVRGFPVIFLYCEASYPAKNINIDVFHKLKQAFPFFEWGFSDHTLDVIQTPRAFCRAGAVVIEKHVNFCGVESPDSPHSLSTEEFKTFVMACRDTLPCEIGPTNAEIPMLLRHKRRVIATRDLNEGDELILGENFGIFRSLVDDTRGAHPFSVYHMVGGVMKVPVKAGCGISLQDVEV